MSEAQLRLALAATQENGRVCICGDDRQAIYAFRGADIHSLDRLKAALGACELGLKTTYRCPWTVVDLACLFVEDYRAAPSAPQGAVLENSSSTLAAAGDFVLSRKNAGLVGYCLDLIRAGKRAYIKGSDIGKAALALVEKLGYFSTLEALAGKLRAWRETELQKIEGDYSPAGAIKRERILDRYEVVDAFIEGSDSYPTLLDNIRSTFSDTPKEDAIMCSTVHKAKGLEAPNVFLVVSSFKRSSDEEDNICYVAATRAKEKLHLLGTRRRFVEGPPPPGGFEEDER
jgi:superfamily I DNA/RNA helicase